MIHQQRCAGGCGATDVTLTPYVVRYWRGGRYTDSFIFHFCAPCVPRMIAPDGQFIPAMKETLFSEAWPARAVDLAARPSIAGDIEIPGTVPMCRECGASPRAKPSALCAPCKWRRTLALRSGATPRRKQGRPRNAGRAEDV